MSRFLIKAAEQGATTQDITSSSMNFMLIFNIFISVYLLYYAIRGTGKVYENDYPKEMKEAHSQLLRKFCWITGSGMLILTILELVQGGTQNIWTIISIVFVLVCIVVYFILFRVRFKEYLSKPKKNKNNKK